MNFNAIPITWLITIFLLSFYLLIFTGNMCSDTYYSYLTAESILVERTLALKFPPREEVEKTHHLPQSRARYTHAAPQGISGGYYSKYGTGWAIFIVPFYILGSLISKIFPGIDPTYVKFFVVGTTGPLMGAFSCLLLFLIARKLNYSPKYAVFISLVYGVGTMNVYYSREPYVESLDAILIMLALYFFIKFKEKDNILSLFNSGMFIALTFSTKFYNVLLILPFMLGILVILREKEKLNITYAHNIIKTLCVFLTPIILLIFLIGTEYYIKYGSPIKTGYSSQITTNPFYIGFYGLLFSSGRGIFFYNIPIFLSFLGLKKFWTENKEIAIIIFPAFILYLITISNLSNWSAGESWGPRFFLPFIALLLLPILSLLRGMDDKNKIFKYISITLLLSGFFIQIPTMIIDIGKWNLVAKDTKAFTEKEILFSPEMSPIIGGWKILISKIGNETIEDNTFKNKSISEVDYSKYNESNIWSLVLLRGKVTRYDGSITFLPVGGFVKVLTIVITFLLISTMIFSSLLILRFVKEEL